MLPTANSTGTMAITLWSREQAWTSLIIIISRSTTRWQAPAVSWLSSWTSKWRWVFKLLKYTNLHFRTLCFCPSLMKSKFSATHRPSRTKMSQLTVKTRDCRQPTAVTTPQLRSYVCDDRDPELSSQTITYHNGQLFGQMPDFSHFLFELKCVHKAVKSYMNLCVVL